MVVAPAEVVVADREQARVFPLAAGVGLQADVVVAGDRDQPVFEILDDLQQTGRIRRGARTGGSR